MRPFCPHPSRGDSVSFLAVIAEPPGAPRGRGVGAPRSEPGDGARGGGRDPPFPIPVGPCRLLAPCRAEPEALAEQCPQPRYHTVCEIFGTRVIWKNAVILGFTA